MAEDRALLKKDLDLVLKLDARMHYDNHAEVKYVLQMVTTKKMFVSSLGQRYQKKLESILNGGSAGKCMFCGKECAEETVICPTCMARLQPPAKEQRKDEATTPKEEVKNVVAKEAVSEKESKSVREEQSRTNPSKEVKTGSKAWVWKVILAVVAIIIAFVEGFDMAFSLLMLVSLGVLIYNAVKGKPKKNAAIACVVFFVLTGVSGLFGEESKEPVGNNDVIVDNGADSSVEEGQSNVTSDIGTFLLEYDNAMEQLAYEISPEVEFYVELELVEENELRKTYQVNILDVTCGSVQFVRNEENDTSWDSIAAYSSRRDPMGVIIIESLLRVMSPGMSIEEMESFLHEIEISDENAAYKYYGDYVYAFINDSNGLMLLISNKEKYMENVTIQNGDF